MIDEKKIEACPFCGERAKLVQRPNRLWVVACTMDALCRGWECTDKTCEECKDGYVSKKEAIKAWNARKPRAIDEGKLHRLWFRHSSDLNPRVAFFIKKLIQDYTAGLLWEDEK